MSQYHVIASAEAFARLDGFSTVIDVRSPAEFAEDRLPGAVNWPVLDNDERRIVGTLYKQDPLEARKVGAAIVARRPACSGSRSDARVAMPTSGTCSMTARPRPINGIA